MCIICALVNVLRISVLTGVFRQVQPLARERGKFKVALFRICRRGEKGKGRGGWEGVLSSPQVYEWPEAFVGRIKVLSICGSFVVELSPGETVRLRVYSARRSESSLFFMRTNMCGLFTCRGYTTVFRAFKFFNTVFSRCLFSHFNFEPFCLTGKARDAFGVL